MVLRTTKKWPDTIILPWNNEEEHTNIKDAEYNWWCEGCYFDNDPVEVIIDEGISTVQEDAVSGGWGTSEDWNGASAWESLLLEIE